MKKIIMAIICIIPISFYTPTINSSAGQSLTDSLITLGDRTPNNTQVNIPPLPLIQQMTDDNAQRQERLEEYYIRASVLGALCVITGGFICSITLFHLLAS